MKASETVQKMIQTKNRTTVLATTDKSGNINIAMFGSLELVDEGTMRMMLGDNRTYANLTENKKAACLVTLPGKTGMSTEGCRLYLTVNRIMDDGEEWEQVKSEIKARIGGAAEILKHLVIFDIKDVRPILDLGQKI